MSHNVLITLFYVKVEHQEYIVMSWKHICKETFYRDNTAVACADLENCCEKVSPVDVRNPSQVYKMLYCCYWKSHWGMVVYIHFLFKKVVVLVMMRKIMMMVDDDGADERSACVEVLSLWRAWDYQQTGIPVSTAASAVTISQGLIGMKRAKPCGCGGFHYPSGHLI